MATPGSTTWKGQHSSRDLPRPVTIYIPEPCILPLPPNQGSVNKEGKGDYVTVMCTNHGYLSKPLTKIVTKQLEGTVRHWDHLKVLDNRQWFLCNQLQVKPSKHGVQAPRDCGIGSCRICCLLKSANGRLCVVNKHFNPKLWTLESILGNGY